jgi:hypothetical protein
VNTPEKNKKSQGAAAKGGDAPEVDEGAGESDDAKKGEDEQEGGVDEEVGVGRVTLSGAGSENEFALKPPPTSLKCRGELNNGHTNLTNAKQHTKTLLRTFYTTAEGADVVSCHVDDGVNFTMHQLVVVTQKKLFEAGVGLSCTRGVVLLVEAGSEKVGVVVSINKGPVTDSFTVLLMQELTAGAKKGTYVLSNPPVFHPRRFEDVTGKDYVGAVPLEMICEQDDTSPDPRALLSITDPIVLKV